MDLAAEMKFNSRVVSSFCIQKPFTLRQVNQMAVFIHPGICLFKSCKLFQLFWIITCYPACFIKRKCVELDRRSIFLQQAILNYFKLQFTNTPDDLFITTMLRK